MKEGLLFSVTGELIHTTEFWGDSENFVGTQDFLGKGSDCTGTECNV